MKIPKCPKTVTGKHNFQRVVIPVYGGTSVGRLTYGDIPRCTYCKLVDDREEK